MGRVEVQDEGGQMVELSGEGSDPGWSETMLAGRVADEESSEERTKDRDGRFERVFREYDGYLPSSRTYRSPTGARKISSR